MQSPCGRHSHSKVSPPVVALDGSIGVAAAAALRLSPPAGPVASVAGGSGPHVCCKCCELLCRNGVCDHNCPKTPPVIRGIKSPPFGSLRALQSSPPNGPISGGGSGGFSALPRAASSRATATTTSTNTTVTTAAATTASSAPAAAIAVSTAVPTAAGTFLMTTRAINAASPLKPPQQPQPQASNQPVQSQPPTNSIASTTVSSLPLHSATAATATATGAPFVLASADGVLLTAFQPPQARSTPPPLEPLSPREKSSAAPATSATAAVAAAPSPTAITPATDTSTAAASAASTPIVRTRFTEAEDFQFVLAFDTVKKVCSHSIGGKLFWFDVAEYMSTHFGSKRQWSSFKSRGQVLTRRIQLARLPANTPKTERELPTPAEIRDTLSLTALFEARAGAGSTAAPAAATPTAATAATAAAAAAPAPYSLPAATTPASTPAAQTSSAASPAPTAAASDDAPDALTVVEPPRVGPRLMVTTIRRKPTNNGASPSTVPGTATSTSPIPPVAAPAPSPPALVTASTAAVASSARSAAASERAANACVSCYKRHVKCDGNTPCERCVKSKIECQMPKTATATKRGRPLTTTTSPPQASAASTADGGGDSAPKKTKSAARPAKKVKSSEPSAAAETVASPAPAAASSSSGSSGGASLSTKPKRITKPSVRALGDFAGADDPSYLNDETSSDDDTAPADEKAAAKSHLCEYCGEGFSTSGRMRNHIHAKKDRLHAPGKLKYQAKPKPKPAAAMRDDSDGDDGDAGGE